jgi:hypothetical protein
MMPPSYLNIIVALFVIFTLFLIVSSILGMQETRTRLHYKEQFALSADASTINQKVISVKMSNDLSGMVNNSFWVKQFSIIAVDVAVMLPVSQIYQTVKAKNSDTVTIARDFVLTKEFLLDTIACPEQPSAYLSSSQHQCAAVNQLIHNDSEFSCLVRVNDAYYKLRSLCLKVRFVDNNSGASRVLAMSPASLLLYYLNPIAITVEGNPVKVTDVVINESSTTNDTITLTTEGAMTVTSAASAIVVNSAPVSVTVYYLDYVKPTSAIMQSIFQSQGEPQIYSQIQMAQKKVTVVSNSTAFVYDFSEKFKNKSRYVKKTSGTKIAFPDNSILNSGFITGVPNIAKLSLKFGNITDTTRILQRTLTQDNLKTNDKFVDDKKYRSACGMVPQEQNILPTASFDPNFNPYSFISDPGTPTSST